MKILSKLVFITSAIFVCAVTKTYGADLSQTSMDKLVKASGFEFQITGFSESLITQLSALDPANIYATDSQLEVIFAEVEKVSSADLISTEFRRALKERLSEDQALALLTWYESDLGRSIVLAEQAGSSEESLKQMQENTEQLLEDTVRTSLAKKIIATADTNRLIFNTQKNMIMVVQSVVAKLNRPFAENVTRPNVMTPELSEQIMTAVEQQTILFLLNSLKQFDQDQIGQYYEVLQQPNMQLFLDVYLTGFENALDIYAGKITSSLGELFVDQGWNITPDISVAYPGGEDLTFQAFDEVSTKLLAGWTGETLDFYIEAQEVPRFDSFDKKWSSIEKGYKSVVDNKKILKIHKGSFLNPQGLEVQFRVTGWNINGEPAGQVVYLIQNENISYMAVAVPVDMDRIEAVTIRSISILKTALLLK